MNDWGNEFDESAGPGAVQFFGVGGLPVIPSHIF